MGYYLMSKYYEKNNTSINYKNRLLGTKKTYSYFYYDAYYQILNELSVSQIFGPYKYFTVQSLNSWFEKLKSFNTTIDSEQINKSSKTRNLNYEKIDFNGYLLIYIMF